MAQQQQQFTARKGSYTKRELSLLATSLGFPGSLLTGKFHSQFTELSGLECGAEEEAVVSEKAVVQLLTSGELFKTLEKIFNRHAAWYNVKSIRKAMQLIRHRSLGFFDISLCRVAFEVYSEEDGSGMAAEVSQVQLALKMAERVCSPSRLRLEIQRFADVSDVPSRLQLYEFMDIAALCGRISDEETRMASELCLSGTASGSGSRHDLDVADFDRILMTSDDKLLAYLEEDYQQTLHGKKKRPSDSTQPLTTPPTPALVKDQIVCADTRKSLVSLGEMQSRALTPCLEASQSQLYMSRCGFHTHSGELQTSVVPSPRSKSPLKSSHSYTSYLPHSTVSLHNSRSPSRLQSSVKSHASKSHKSSKIEGSCSPADPLLRPLVSNQFLPRQSPVRLSLQHKPTTATQTLPQQFATAECSRDTKTIEHLEEEISDICANSVVKARDMLRSSLSAIPPSHLSGISPTAQDCSVVNSSQRPATVESSKRKKSSRGNQRILLQPIVSANEREKQQFLIDSLLWSTQRRKKHYQVIA